jgi:hypothetical protein
MDSKEQEIKAILSIEDPSECANEVHLWELRNDEKFPYPFRKYSPKEYYVHEDFGLVPYPNGRCG